MVFYLIYRIYYIYNYYNYYSIYNHYQYYPCSGSSVEQTHREITNKARAFARALLFLGGDDLLSHFRSTIGAVRFNFSVRNGKRWSPHAVITLISFDISPFLWLRWAWRYTYKLKKYTCRKLTFITLSLCIVALIQSSLFWQLPALRSIRAISTAQLTCRHAYTCSLSTSSSSTALIDILSWSWLRA